MSSRITKDSLTPLMQQYQRIKQNYSDAILFFRLGDFYEMFGEDALKASPILEIVLTKRHNVPMCGVPHHSVSNYIAKLIRSGFKVAICEQLEDVSQAKGIVKREVVRLITPGTLIEENLLETKKNNYLLAIFHKTDRRLDNGGAKWRESGRINQEQIGIAYIDISTGEFYITEFYDDNSFLKTISEIARLNPSEFVLPESHNNSNLAIYLKRLNYFINFIDDYFFELNYSKEKILKTFQLPTLKSFGIEDKLLAISASGGILKYLEDTQKTLQEQLPLRPPKFYSTEEYMLLNDSTIDSLELIENQITRTKENTLLEIIDQANTAMGSRQIRKFLLKPLTNIEKINQRQEVVEYFINEGILRRKIAELLKSISDIERILSRIASNLATPRDLIALKESFITVTKIRSTIESTETLENFIDSKPKILIDIINNLVDTSTIVKLISETIVDNPPANLSNGGVIKKGYNSELDELRQIASSGKTYLAELEYKERQRTGIGSLKIGYTSVFGYYIEVTKPNLHLVPADYIRKQTLVNSERFITEELREYEQKVLTAEEKISRIETQIFSEVKSAILKEAQKIYSISSAIAELDTYISFAKIAAQNNYCKPKITDDYCIRIEDGRHPVLEKKLVGKTFVPNDTYLDGSENQIILLTGPNMSGKSTYLRQVALIVIMSQIGSYVPATKAEIGIVDRIFTRIGATENLAGGESTFMVEMRQTANILHNSTERSLLILDEIGRGTSTYDGISIAWSIVEYLNRIKNAQAQKMQNDNVGPKVLFATHYFELTELEQKLKGVKNFNVSVHEWKDEIVFLHKIVPGYSDRSYGIHVAKLAGLPESVVTRAKNILIELERKSENIDGGAKLESKKTLQLDLFSQKTHPLEVELAKLDIDRISPLQALQLLANWKERYGKS
ncbi:MAG: DNA mismatch repair protein MutS [Elusimicrobiota bacterium]|nr:DNA mismatch repair protein MutS [Elusimicrobiota bacterium]